MLFCHCKMCRTPLYADDAHAKCVSCLGKSHADAVLSGANSSHRESFSLTSLRSQKAFFSESESFFPCPPTAIGWKARAIHPSKPCRATSALAGRAYSAAGQTVSALHSIAVLQVFQAKMLASEEAGLDAASLRDLRKATDLVLRYRTLKHHPV